MSKNHDEFTRHGVRPVEVWVFPLINFSAQKALVALKYAMLTDSEYERFMTAPAHVAHRWNLGIQLITGWLGPSDELISTELNLASRLTGVDVDASFEHVVSDSDSASLDGWAIWKRLLNDPDDDEGEDGDGGGGAAATPGGGLKKVVFSPELVNVKTLSSSALSPCCAAAIENARAAFDAAEPGDEFMPLVGLGELGPVLVPPDAEQNVTNCPPRQRGGVGKVTHIPIHTLLRRLIRIASNEAIPIPMGASNLINVVVVSVPVMMRFRYFNTMGVMDTFFGGGSAEAMFVVTAAMFLSMNVSGKGRGGGGATDDARQTRSTPTHTTPPGKYFGRTLLFLSSGTAHYYRVYLLFSFLTRLLRVVPGTFPNMPSLQLSARNIRALIGSMELLHSCECVCGVNRTTRAPDAPEPTHSWCPVQAPN